MTGSCENHHETIVFDVVTHHTDTLGTRVPNVMGYLKKRLFHEGVSQDPIILGASFGEVQI